MVTRVLVLESSGRVIVVDAGMGTNFSKKQTAIYGLEDLDLAKGLDEVGCPPERVTDVVVTHLHFDHAGGLAVARPDGTVAPLFPNAVHHVQRGQWQWAHAPSSKDAGSFMLDPIDRLEGQVRWNLVDGVSEIAPGVRVFPVQGHSRGMQVVVVSAPDGTALFGADLFPTRWHLRPVWNMAYDNEPVLTVQEKRWYLRQALAGRWTIVLEHDPELADVRVTDDQGGFEPGGLDE